MVTRAKYAISFFNPVQGRTPQRPMPILLVAATIKVRSWGFMLESISRDLKLSSECSPGCNIVGEIRLIGNGYGFGWTEQFVIVSTGVRLEPEITRTVSKS